MKSLTVISLVMLNVLAAGTPAPMPTERAPNYANVEGRMLPRTAFKGVFVYGKDGLRGRDDKTGRESDDHRVETVDEVVKKAQWRRVEPSGADAEIRLAAEDVKRYLIDLPELARDFAEDDPRLMSRGPRTTEKDDGAKEPGSPNARAADPMADAGRARDATTEAILGADTRVEVSPADWRPAKQSGLLTFTGGSCSGALIGPRHVLTAAHCVHSGSGGDWYGGFRFYPGRSTAGGASPYGSYGWVRAWTYSAWTSSSDSDYDLALIELSAAPGIGWLSFGWSSSMSTTWLMYHKGYSGDKPFGSQWSTSGLISNVWTNRFYTDTTDTTGGNSGGPWYRYVSGSAVVYGPHSGWNAYWYWFGAQRNRHTRITSSKFSMLCDWIDDPAVC